MYRDKAAWRLLWLYLVPAVLSALGPMLESPIGEAVALAEIVMWAWALVELGIIGGTRGPNRYGPDPLGRDAQAGSPVTS